MSTRTTAMTPPAAPLVSRPWWQLGLGAGLLAAVIDVILFAGYQVVTGAPLQAPSLTGGGIGDLPLAVVAAASLIPPLAATLLAIALSRWTRAANVWFIAIVVILAAPSLLSPLGLPEPITMGNKLTLALMHVVVAGATLAAFVPRLAAGRD